MRVLVIGAAGHVGSAALAACLEKNHTVTALVRNPSKLPSEIRCHPRLRIVKGELTSHALLVDTVRDQDAVIQASVYGSNSSSGTSDSETMMRCIVDAVQEVQVSRRRKLLAAGSGGGKVHVIRLWVLSGQALEKIPAKIGAVGGDVILIHPKYYKNYAFLKEEANDVDWRLVCPGRIEMDEVRVLLYEFR